MYNDCYKAESQPVLLKLLHTLPTKLRKFCTGWQAFIAGKHLVDYIYHYYLTRWGRVTHICVGKLTIIGWDNGLSPGRRQAIIWTNAGILLIGTLGINFSKISNEIRIFSFKKMGLKVSSAKWRPFCLGFNVLKPHQLGWRQWVQPTCQKYILMRQVMMLG